MEELRGTIASQPIYLQSLVDQSDALTALWLVIANALVMMQAGFLLSPPVSALHSMRLIDKAISGELCFTEDQFDTTLRNTAE